MNKERRLCIAWKRGYLVLAPTEAIDEPNPYTGLRIMDGTDPELIATEMSHAARIADRAILRMKAGI